VASSSAIFTGPSQLKIACALVPLVKFVMWILYPIAGPLAKLLDWLLHDHDDGDSDDVEHTKSTSAAYTRGELAALIRIQYEERMAAKKKRKRLVQEGAAAVVLAGDHVGGLDFTARKSLRATKSQLAHEASVLSLESHQNSVAPSEADGKIDRDSLHVDEVVMIEGALKMNTKTAIDVFTSYRKVFCVPSNMILDEKNLVKVYASGFTRIPVHEPGSRTAVIGTLMTKQLIVVDSNEARPVGTLPLRTPRCVGPETPLVRLVNMFQTGGSGSRGGVSAVSYCRLK